MPAGGFSGWWGSDGGSSQPNTYPTGRAAPSQPNTLSEQNRQQSYYGGGGGGQTGGSNPYGAFDDVRIGGTTPPGAAVGLYGLPGGTSLPPNPYAGAAAAANTYYGPQSQILADQLKDLKEQYGLSEADADYQRGLLRRDNALAQQSLGLDKQALGISKGLTGTQLANLDKLKGILKQQYGLVGEQFANQLAGLKIDESSLRDNSSRKQFDLRSDLTARGAFNTVANERGTGRINRDLMYGLGQINVQRSAADIARRGSILGLDEKGIGYANTEAGLKANLANAGIDAARLGISEQQLANSLQDGLDNIGLGSLMSLGELMAGIGGTNTQSSQLLTTIYNMIAGMQGLPLLPVGGAPKVPQGTLGNVRDR